MEKQETILMSDNNFEWLITTEGTNKYIGRATNWNPSEPHTPDAIIFDEIYELVVVVMPTPQGNAKQVGVMPLWLNTHNTTVRIYRYGAVALLADMDSVDSNKYISLIVDARKIALQQRSQDSGIVHPSNVTGGRTPSAKDIMELVRG